MTFLKLFFLTLLCPLLAYGSLIKKIDYQLSSRTDILVIYKNKKLIYEEYKNDYKPNQKHRLWSISKSITSLLMAKAIKEGRVELHHSICDYVPHKMNLSASQCLMTIEDLLFWRSGTQWNELYIGFNTSQSQVLHGLYGEGIKDFAQYYFSLGHSTDLGPYQWNYSTGDSHILAYILKQVYSPADYEELPWSHLFNPLKIDATFERDHQGLYMGGAYVFMSAHDLYKIGQFTMDELNKSKDLPQGWMKHCLEAKKEVYLDHDMIDDAIAPAIPGGHWWLNKASNPDIQVVPWPNAPEDTYAAFGVFGQMMFIIPSENLVIVRLAQDIKGGFNRINFLKHVLKYAKGHK